MTEQLYSQQVAEAESPVTLQARANAAGMVPVTSPVFLRLSDGKVLGDPTPAEGIAPLAKTTTSTPAATTSAATTSTATTSTDAARPDSATTTPKSTTGPTR